MDVLPTEWVECTMVVPWKRSGDPWLLLLYMKTVVRVCASLVGRLAKDKVGVFVDEHMRPKYPNARTQNHISLKNGCAWIIA